MSLIVLPDTDNFLIIINDITQENQLKMERLIQEQQMLQQSRLAQMGEMISMIAHQWRQPLGALASTALNMKFKLELESFDLTTQEGRDELNNFFIEKLENIEYYIENLSTTIDDFRNFYKPNKKVVMSSFKDVVGKVLKIIQTSIEVDNIVLIEEYSNEMIFEMYDNEMMQVILNILKNAQDNFKEKKISNPQIKITSIGDTLYICDNGGGISNEILEKIFDPYFSTKSEKNGTGLGLYMSKQIIEEHHNGKLSVKNQNDGVSFTMTIGNIQ
jgi:signal transduction histidine kinase